VKFFRIFQSLRLEIDDLLEITDLTDFKPVFKTAFTAILFIRKTDFPGSVRSLSENRYPPPGKYPNRRHAKW